MKRTITYLLSTLLLCLLPVTTSAEAVNQDTIQETKENTDQVLAEQDAAYAEPEFIKYLADCGVEVGSGDRILLISPSSKSRSIPTRSLEIIKQNGDRTENYFVMSYLDQNGNVSATNVPVTVNTARSNQVKTLKWSPTSKSLITISMGVGYYHTGDLLSGTYFQPYATNFYYSKNNSSATVNYITESCQTEGTLCDSNGGTIQEDYVFYIEQTINNPGPEVVYQKEGSLPNGRKIYYTGGSSSGVFITLETKINGIFDGKTFAMHSIQ